MSLGGHFAVIVLDTCARAQTAVEKVVRQPLVFRRLEVASELELALINFGIHF